MSSGCTGGIHPFGSGVPSIESRIEAARSLALERGWLWPSQPALAEPVQVAMKASLPKGGTLTVYIEGDGLAWLSPALPSPDPTPVRALALQLAIQDPGPAAYLGRPCQYVNTLAREHCRVSVWTTHRYSSQAVKWSSAALDHIKRSSSADSLRLVGYSGGAVMALLLAGRRTDVQEVVTIAGNLDIEYWARLMHLSPLVGSLNPADEWSRLRLIPQVHWVGRLDPIVPVGVVQRYVDRFPDGQKPKVNVIDDFDHQCCWVERWPKLLSHMR